MKYVVYLPIILLFACNPYTRMTNKATVLATKQYAQASTEALSRSKDIIPRTIKETDGKLVSVGIYDWCSGFYAGNLWQLYNLTGNEKWKTEAIQWTEMLAPVRNFTEHHDLGFMMNCSYGSGYHLGAMKNYDTILIQSARSLCTRFQPKAGIIKSWNNFKKHKCPVIIDNMMNLELLFEATRLSGDSSFWKVAVSHANTTKKNHFRKDYSSYHVVCYAENGTIEARLTAQGLADESAWARGQAWGLYGFTTCYRYTHDTTYLNQANHIARYWLDNKNMPSDGIPYWDFNAPDTAFHFDRKKFPTIPRDASAAAVAASAFIELAQYSTGSLKKEYLAAAHKIVKSLTYHYLADTSRNKYFLLDHSVGHLLRGVEVDVPLVYADYYYLEALGRLNAKSTK
jgi:hypothetical protein